MKTHPKLATPSDLSEKGREEIAKDLNLLAADIFTLYLKSKNFHWHVSGCHFRDLHLLFDEQADQIFAMSDTITERARKLGFSTLHSIGEIKKLQRIKDDDSAFLEPKEMLLILLEDNQTFAKNLRKTHAKCEKHNDRATASILEIYLDETERRIWFLFELTK